MGLDVGTREYIGFRDRTLIVENILENRTESRVI